MVSKLNPTKFSISLRRNATFSAPLTSDTIPKITEKIIQLDLLEILEIKPCGLGSRIRDIEADLIYW